MSPKYSIVIPAYNRAHTLKQAIYSCLKQTVKNFEIIVSDDDSKDDLKSVANSFCDPRIRYLRSLSHLGAVENHRYGVANSIGQYVQILHSDDILLPECLEKAGLALESNSRAAAVYFSCVYVVGESIVGVGPMPRLYYVDERTLTNNLWLDKFPGVNPTCCLFRRSSYEQVGGYLSELTFAYDWEIYMRFLRHGGGVIFLPEILCGYRRHAGQVAQTSSYEGLYDILKLWRKKEYSYFGTDEIADLIITELSISLRTRGNCRELIRGILDRGPVGRVLAGIPVALVRRINRRLKALLAGCPTVASTDNNFVIPSVAWPNQIVRDSLTQNE